MLGLELGVIMSDFSPLIVWTAPVSSMNVQWKGGRFWCSSILASLCLYSEYTVTNGNRILLSSSSGHPGTVMACAVWGSFSNKLGNRIVLSTALCRHFPSSSRLVFSLVAEVLVRQVVLFPSLRTICFQYQFN